MQNILDNGYLSSVKEKVNLKLRNPIGVSTNKVTPHPYQDTPEVTQTSRSGRVQVRAKGWLVQHRGRGLRPRQGSLGAPEGLRGGAGALQPRGRRPLAAPAPSRGRSRRRGVALGDGGRAAAAHWTSGGDPGREALAAAATAAGSRRELGRSVQSVMRGSGGAPGAGPAGESAGGGRRGPGRWRRGLAAAPRPGPGGGPPSPAVLEIGAPGVPVGKGPHEDAAAEGQGV